MENKSETDVVELTAVTVNLVVPIVAVGVIVTFPVSESILIPAVSAGEMENLYLTNLIRS